MDVEPASVHDLTTARRHVLGACYPAAAAGLPILADAGYEGGGISVHTPGKKHPGAAHQHLHLDNQAYNQLLRSVRSLGERAAAELKERWRALKHITLSPYRIGGEPPRFRTGEPIGSFPEWRSQGVEQTQEFHS